MYENEFLRNELHLDILLTSHMHHDVGVQRDGPSSGASLHADAEPEIRQCSEKVIK